ncbi:MAG: hypothetical protein M3N98_00930 [Actinomycetota bacterium]|nr:hypothetical protein [Actinomycetota bacterium]
MDENEVVAQDTERLDHLEEDIQQGRHHLKDMTNVGEPYLFEDDERTDAEKRGEEAPPPQGAAGDADAPPPPG